MKAERACCQCAADTVQWLPTGALQCLRALFHARPHNQLICADFDALPEVQVQGVNAPLVATTVRTLCIWCTGTCAGRSLHVCVTSGLEPDSCHA